ncbi:MAG TPA: tetratricopeptide repeat protein, partial [Gemmatimonadaceae bacterium]
RGDAARAVAWGWMRTGDLTRAREVLARHGEEGDERVTAWMALYEGDLKTARTGLRRLDETTHEAVLALSVLARTRADTSRMVGSAFLALARSDTAAAVEGFEQAATSLTDASSLLLTMAARLSIAAADTARSLRLWQTVVERYPDAPEAAEAELDWARVLRRRGETKAAVARLEHLILTYPQSALVPQARRELELAKGAIPPE